MSEYLNLSSPEKEKSEKFPAIVVLGAGLKDNASNLPSLESKMRTLAAGEAFKEGIAEKIIFCGGKTAGEDWPAEAEAMADYLRKKFPEISDEAVVVNRRPIDTSESAEDIMLLLQEQQIPEVILITSMTHLPRAERLFQNYGIKIQSDEAAEKILMRRSPHYHQFLKSYLLHSPNRWQEKWHEFLLRSLLVVDAKGLIPRHYAHRLRGEK